ncbi:MAG TPA: hypothetical protein VGG10_07190 [Rhizomicrobium sp.]|jgi:hypothetical protein
MRPTKKPAARNRPANSAKSKPAVRMPQRSAAVSGDEKKGLTPIAAEQKRRAKRRKV